MPSPPPSARSPPTDAMLMIVPGRCSNACSHAALREQQRALEVHLEGLVVATLVDTSNSPSEVRVGRRVVDEDVELAEPIDRRADRTFSGVGVAGVGGEDLDLAGPSRHGRPRAGPACGC
jgi:hypothetical protein